MRRLTTAKKFLWFHQTFHHVIDDVYKITELGEQKITELGEKKITEDSRVVSYDLKITELGDKKITELGDLKSTEH